MVSERVANASRDTLVREPAGAPERSAGFFFSPRDWRGASVPRFLVSLTELQSYVTRKTPALNNAKPERTIASIALASVHERSIPMSLCRLSRLMAKSQTGSGLTERNVALLRPIARFMWPLRP